MKIHTLNMTNSKSHHPHSVKGSKTCITVRLLEDTSLEIDVTESATGKWLCEEVCRSQGVLEEREYFGLRYLQQDKSSLPTKQWLDPTRGVHSQLKNTHPKVVSFRFKNYPSEPLTDLRLAKTHYLLYQQLRRDLFSGRLIAAVDEMAKLGALVVQVELGDSSVQDTPLLSANGSVDHSYLTAFRVLHNQTHRMQCLMLEEHKKLEGLLPSEAAGDLIQLASSLETYGIDPILVKTKAHGSRPIHLGLTHSGVAEFVGNRCRKCRQWSTVSWMTCDGKNFIVTTAEEKAPGKKKGGSLLQSAQYKCESKAAARALWEWASDRRLFLTLEKSSSAKPVKAKTRLLSRTHTFTFSGRCRREVLGRLPLAAATLPANFSTSQTEELPDQAAGSSALHVADGCSVSMMGLSNASNTPELKPLRPICERPSDEACQVEIPAASSSNTVAVVGQLLSLEPIATGLELAVSEPTGLAQASPLSYGSSSAAEETRSVQATRGGANPGRSALARQLEPLFTSLPRRRYAPEAMVRQTRLADYLGQSASHRSDAFDKDDAEEAERIEAEAALAALQSATEEAQAWIDAQHDASSSQLSRSESGGTSYFSFLRSSSPKPSPPPPPEGHRPDHYSSVPAADQPLSAEATANSQVAKASGDLVRPASSDQTAVVAFSGWRLAAVSIGVLTAASVIGFGFLMESSEIYAPVGTALRGHSWLLDFDYRFYRPARAALFSLWRR